MTIGVVTAAVLALFYLCGLTKLHYVRMDSLLQTEVVRGDSSRRLRPRAPLEAGDILRAEGTLHALDTMEDAVLVFRSGMGAVTVKIGDEERARFGSEGAGTYPVVVPIKEDDWGKDFSIEFLAGEGRPESALTDVFLMKHEDAALYPLVLKETKFVLFVTLFLLGALIFVFSFVSAVLYHRFIELFFLSLFMLSASVTVLGNSGFLYLLLKEDAISANAGMIASFFVPAAFFAYYFFAAMEMKKVRRTLSGILAVAFFALPVAGFILSRMQGVSFAAIHAYLFYAVSAVSALMLLMEIFGGPPASRNEDFAIKIGVIVGAVLILLECARRNLYRWDVTDPYAAYYPKLDYPAAAMLILCVLLMLHQYARTTRRVRHKEHAALMQELSYTDILSGIPNRHYCDRKLAAIGANAGAVSPVDYTLFFIDINSLREVNEKLGFDTGDELIRCVGEAVTDAMRGCGADERGGRIGLPDEEDPQTKHCFCGRWGGDEFMACTFRLQADAFETTLISRIAAINIEKRIPGEASVSLGSCDFSGGSYDRVLDALVKADRAMYERKKQYHASHDDAEV